MPAAPVGPAGPVGPLGPWAPCKPVGPVAPSPLANGAPTYQIPDCVSLDEPLRVICIPNLSPAETVAVFELVQLEVKAVTVHATAVATSLSVIVNVIEPPPKLEVEESSTINPLNEPPELALISQAVWAAEPAVGVHEVAIELYKGVVLFGGQTG